ARQRLDDLARRLHRTAEYHARDRSRTLEALSSRLQAVSPRNTLERGYAIITADDGKRVLRRADSVAPGDAVVARLAHGALICEVEDVLE
ncbi:MAG: exodeoxyribonuclease VII large subunit, partial [Pseudomonadota bacterium]|nr:exodeoxyribonuclease VII large subunit [Pseudomonadota bacterium]